MLHQGRLDREMLTTLDGSMFIPKVINLITLGWKHAITQKESILFGEKSVLALQPLPP